MSDSEVERLKAEIAGLSAELERYKERERGLEDSRRAMLYMLEDLNESSADIDRARREWEATFNGISWPVYLHDIQLRVLRANKAYVKESGMELDNIIGRPYYEVFPLREEPFICCLKAIESGCIEEEEVSTGSGRTFRIKYYPIMDEAGKYLLSVHIMEDITESKKAEKERTKLEEQLRHAQKMEAVGTLAGGIAHDFNNILNVIMGYGGMVMDKLEAESPSKEQMSEILSAAGRAAELTKRLLLFSRKEVAEMKPTDVNHIVRNMEKMLSRIVREDIRLVTDLMCTNVMIMADVGQIEQVLMNLASNARDAMPKGGTLIFKTELREITEEFIRAYGYGKAGTYAVISVTDTGTGIDKEKQTRIFDPFFTTKEVGKGTGLGLSIAYGIINQHNGYIKVYSETDKGTTFKIWLPVLEDKITITPENETVGQQKGGTETILLAEDDASMRIMSKLILESYGYTVITAEDGEDAIAKFMDNREKISLSLIDMIMPRKNGKEVAEEIRKVSPQAKIFFASGHTMDVIMTKELTEGGYDFIHKPFLPRDLLERIREILDR